MTSHNNKRLKIMMPPPCLKIYLWSTFV